MRNLNWQVVGYAVLIVLLMVLAGVLHNWFALAILIVAFVQMHVTLRAMHIARGAVRALKEVSVLLRGMIGELDNGNAKD